MGQAGTRSDRRVERYIDEGGTRRLCVGAACLVAGLLGVSSACAQEFTPANYLVDLHLGSELSDLAAGLANGGYDLALTGSVSLYELYRTDWPDIRIEMMTQLTENFGVLWGGSTGERGVKYTIDPSISLGFVTQARTSASSALSLTFRTILAGNLTEHTCEADYGDIAGVHTVNCRLAADPMPPEKTLQYLVNAEPNRFHIALSFNGSF